MKLSIVTINRNNAEGLARTLDSVKAQTYKEIEHIIIDGGSSDGSVEVIQNYVRDVSCMMYNVLWVSEKDKGIYNAMNKGIKRSSGDYIFILNSGDELASTTVLEKIISVIEQFEIGDWNFSATEARLTSFLKNGLQILMGNIVHMYGKGKKVRERKRAKTNDLTPRPIEASMLTFYRGTIPHDAAFVRKDLFEKYGFFDESMKICADWKLYLDMIALEGIQPWHVDIDVVLFDMSGVSNTNNELRLAERRMYLEQLLPVSVLRDYDAYAAPIHQYQRLKKHHLWGLVYFIERILFKLEKWRILRP